MSIQTYSIVGYLGGSLIIISLLPQLIKIIKTKSAKDIALETYLLLIIAEVCWIIYGFLKNDIEIIVTNIVSLFLTILITILTIYYQKISQISLSEEILN